MTDLTPFRRAGALRWRRHTQFAAGRGDDGNLITDQGHSMPLDTALPYERNPGPAPRTHALTKSGVGVAVTNPDTLADVHAAICGWCHIHLDRDDVQFD